MRIYAIAPPRASAVTNDLWLKRGAFDAAFSIPATNWSFRIPDGEASKVMVYAYCDTSFGWHTNRQSVVVRYDPDPEEAPHVTLQSPDTVFVNDDEFRRARRQFLPLQIT